MWTFGDNYSYENQGFNCNKNSYCNIWKKFVSAYKGTLHVCTYNALIKILISLTTCSSTTFTNLRQQPLSSLVSLVNSVQFSCLAIKMQNQWAFKSLRSKFDYLQIISKACLIYSFNSRFTHDITKIQTKKLSILLSLYFHVALQHLSLNKFSFWHMSLLVCGCHICVLERDMNVASPYKAFINLGKMFFRIFGISNISTQTRFLVRLFVNLTFFISQILGFLLRAFSLTWSVSTQIYWSCRFIVLGHRYGHRDIMWKHSIEWFAFLFLMVAQNPVIFNFWAIFLLVDHNRSQWRYRLIRQLSVCSGELRVTRLKPG